MLALLAAVAEPVPAAFLARRIGQRTSVVEARLEEQWRPFVQVDDTSDEPTYRPFHDSLRDFCHGDVDPARLSAAERSMARRLARATREAHADLAESFLTTWAGLAAGLPGVLTAATADTDYGMAHLVEHLDLSGRDDDLHALLMCSGTDGSNVWFIAQRRAGGVGAYRRDVARAGEVAARSSRPLTLALRYTLILAALNSVVAASPPAVWARLTAEGRLTLAEALAQAQQIPEAPERAEALTLLADQARPPLREEVQREALAAVAAIGDGFWRVGELWRLYPGLEPGLRADASALVEAIADPYYRVVAQRLIGIDADVGALAAAAAGDHEALDSPSGLAASSHFVEAYTRRRDIAAQLLGSAGYESGADAGVPRLWANHLALLSGSGGELREGIGDEDTVLAAWCALGTAVAPLGAADVDVVASSIVSDRWQWAFLAGAGRDVAPEREADRVAGLRAVVGVVDTAPVRWEAWVAGVSDPIERCRLRLALAERLTEAPGRAFLADAVLTDLAQTPAVPADLLCGAVRGCRPEALEDALDLAARLEEPAPVSAAVGHRLVDDGDLDAATEMLAGLPPPWSWDLGHAIARARARGGEAAAARNLAAALPFAPWRAAVQAELVSGADETTIEAVLVALPPDSRAASRANAAVLAPPVVAERLLLDAAADAAAVDDPAERDLAHLAVGTALALRGRLREGLTAAAAITGHQVRARAQVAVIEQLARGPADLGRDDVLAVLAGDPMTDADSLVAVRAAVLATTPPGPGTAAAASALLAELRRRPRATTLHHLPALLAAIRTVARAGRRR